MQTIKIIHSHVSGSTYAYEPMPVELIDRQYTNEEELPTSVIPQTKSKKHNLHRSNEGKTTSYKHKNHKQRTHSGPREEYLACKRPMGKKHMRPMTPAHRHLDNQTLRCCVAALDSKTIRKLLLIEYPDNLRSYASTVTDPYEDVLDLNLSDTHLPLQCGFKKINSRKQSQLTRDGILLRERTEKAMIQNHNEPFLPIDYYELDWEEPIVDNKSVEPNNSEEYLQEVLAYAEAQEREQKQRFHECVSSLYYTEAKGRALEKRFDECRSLFYPKTRNK